MSAWIDTAKTYAKHVGAVYLDFVAPVALFLVFNTVLSVQTRDPEKMGLLWLNYSQMDADDRKTRYPLDEKGKFKVNKESSIAAALEE
jgi:bifunctional pyridoxal-dependent enzyme with beta-cystathionase and maltose regulon repressor activities